MDRTARCLENGSFITAAPAWPGWPTGLPRRRGSRRTSRGSPSRPARRRDLMERGFVVHSINPRQLDRFRDRFSPAGAKDDRRDARVLGDALRTDIHAFRRLDPMTPEVIELREWSAKRNTPRFVPAVTATLVRFAVLPTVCSASPARCSKTRQPSIPPSRNNPVQREARPTPDAQHAYPRVPDLALQMVGSPPPPLHSAWPKAHPCTNIQVTAASQARHPNTPSNIRKT